MNRYHRFATSPAMMWAGRAFLAAVCILALIIIFLNVNPHGNFEYARSQNTAASYHQFIQKYPNDPSAVEARQKWQEMASKARDDGAIYEAALDDARWGHTPEPLKQFLSDYPGHRKSAEAEHWLQAMTDGADTGDIVDLVNQNEIGVTTEGHGTDSVAVRIESLAPYTVTVKIPAGTFFNSSSAAQSMVATEAVEVTLREDQVQSTNVPAACANLFKGEPQSEDSFTVERAPYQVDLARLIPGLSGFGYAIRQAAVWIVTDNATFENTEELVDGSRNPIIHEDDAAHAMEICDRAGIPITNEAILERSFTHSEPCARPRLKEWLIHNPPISAPTSYRHRRKPAG